jgi:hypothetical protein
MEASVLCFLEPGYDTVQDIPQVPMTAREVLPVDDLVLICLREALASGAGPWD